MKFGKLLSEEIQRSPVAWAPYWLNYKALKKRVKVAKQQPHLHQTEDIESSTVAIDFFRTLEEELRKIAGFYTSEERRYVLRHNQLCARWHHLQDNTAGSYDIVAIERLMLALVHFYQECIQLEHYALLNYQAFSKILKKHDKLTGFSTRVKYMRRKVHQASFASLAMLLKIMEDSERLFFVLDAYVRQQRGRVHPLPLRSKHVQSSTNAKSTPLLPPLARSLHSSPGSLATSIGRR